MAPGSPREQARVGWDSGLHGGPGREDTLASGRKFRTADLEDDCTRECPAILVDFSLPGRRVTLMLDDVARERGYPDILVVDNRPSADGRSDRRSRRGQEAAKGPGVHRPRPRELGSPARRQALLHRSDPWKGQGQQALEGQADAERLDRKLQRRGLRGGPPPRGGGRFRDECLDPHMCRSLDEARRIIERWRIASNETRPHTALRRRRPKRSPSLDRSSDRGKRLQSSLLAHRRSRLPRCRRRC